MGEKDEFYIPSLRSTFIYCEYIYSFHGGFPWNLLHALLLDSLKSSKIKIDFACSRMQIIDVL